VQVDDTTINGSLPIIANGGKARSRGLELTFDWLISADWRLTGSLAHNEAELAESSSEILGDSLTGPLLTPAGSRLPGSPELQASLGLGYTHTLRGGLDLSVNYTAAYMGDIANSIGAEQFASVAPWGGEILPSYTLHNLTVGLASDNWTASFFIDNLTDEYAITGSRTSRRLLAANRGLINDLPLRTYGYYVGRPRTAGVSFTYDF
jgi:outer membrane receptor protein involved in Fe transport